MVLVDTSIWINHLRENHPTLREMLIDGEVACHPFVIGELACGNLKNRTEFFSLLQTLPMVPVAEQDEVLYFIEKQDLMGRGIGFVDIHLLSSARLSHFPLWTSDKRLQSVALEMNLSFL